MWLSVWWIVISTEKRSNGNFSLLVKTVKLTYKEFFVSDQAIEVKKKHDQVLILVVDVCTVVLQVTTSINTASQLDGARAVSSPFSNSSIPL